MQQEPVFVVRELSTLLEKIAEEAVDDIDLFMQKRFSDTPKSFIDSTDMEKSGSQVDKQQNIQQPKTTISPLGDMRQQESNFEDLPAPLDLPPPENP